MVRVVLYSSRSCVYCSMLKEWLKNRGVVFVERVLDFSDPSDVLFMRSNGFMGVPVLEVDGVFVVGFDVKRIDELLKSKGL